VAEGQLHSTQYQTSRNTRRRITKTCSWCGPSGVRLREGSACGCKATRKQTTSSADLPWVRPRGARRSPAAPWQRQKDATQAIQMNLGIAVPASTDGRGIGPRPTELGCSRPQDAKVEIRRLLLLLSTADLAAKVRQEDGRHVSSIPVRRRLRGLAPHSRARNWTTSPGSRLLVTARCNGSNP
jgi:hypothetical protein